MTALDIKFKMSKGYYDISFDNHQLETTSGLDTAILMSLFVDRRADASEVPRVEYRRGWWGNLVGSIVNYNIGSKLWLLIQARKDNNCTNLATTYIYDCLKWLVEDKLADKVTVKTEYSENREACVTNIVIYKNQSVVFSRAYPLWSNTFLPYTS